MPAFAGHTTGRVWRPISDMPQGKRNNPADFNDILASFDRKVSKEPPARPDRRAEPEVEAGSAGPPRPKNWLRRALGNISLPWPSGIGGRQGSNKGDTFME